jgi:hypothetical protein
VRSRIQQLRMDRFDDQADLPSAVFLRTVLDQSQKLIKSKWIGLILPPPPSIYDHLDRADRVATILRKCAVLQDKLDDTRCASSVRDYYRDAIAEQLHGIGPQPLDQKAADDILKELGMIEARLDEPYTSYWMALKKEAQFLVRLAGPVQDLLDTEGDKDDKDASKLLASLSTPPADGDPGAALTFDKNYWFLKVLYSRRAFKDEIKALWSAFKPRANLESVFKVADDLAWKRLVTAVDDKRITIKPIDLSDRRQSLQPLRFALHFEDSVLPTSYFVLNVLMYKWTFTLEETPSKCPLHKAPRSQTWSVTSNGPRITDYMPFPGQLKVQVDIQWLSDDNLKQVGSKQIDPLAIAIGKNAELSLRLGLEGSEIALMAILAAVALATSLPTLYFAKATFGSFGDYTAILAWAIGIDQGKNLIQLLTSYPADRAPPPPVPGS